MKKKQTRVLTKLTSAETNNPIYVDMEQVISIESNYPQYNTLHSSVSSSASLPTATRITIGYGFQIFVKEHYLEILAMAEGRDPAPATVMYGKK